MLVVEATESRTEEAMKNLIQRFIREEEGQDLVEYAFLIVFIAILAIAGMNAVEGSVNALFERISGILDDAAV